jgi:[ribosomal protein S5]-alanine N-acetyltransferase
MQLITPHLILRELLPSDLNAVHAYFSDARFQHFEEPDRTLQDTQANLDKNIQAQEVVPRVRYVLGLVVPPSDTVIGQLSLIQISAAIHEWEIGWGIHPDFWGQGFATEAARALLQLAFTDLDANRVFAICHADNHASYRVMEKLGMQREGRFRQTRWIKGQRFDDVIYSILAEEYEPAKQNPR